MHLNPTLQYVLMRTKTLMVKFKLESNFINKLKQLLKNKTER